MQLTAIAQAGLIAKIIDIDPINRGLILTMTPNSQIEPFRDNFVPIFDGLCAFLP